MASLLKPTIYRQTNFGSLFLTQQKTNNQIVNGDFRLFLKKRKKYWVTNSIFWNYKLWGITV